MQTATADPLVGRTLEGRYRILERIARGGMSTVYSAVDERLDRLVAVKVMNSALSSDPAFSDRFSREARAAARLTHVNTVAVYDQGYDTTGGGHHVFLVMELVEGRTLRDLMRERAGRFTPAEAISIMEPVLSALSAAHRAGIVHRDVKPENILLSDEGVVKVADFGLARAVEADASSTRTGLMMGTVAYCAPEQITRGQADQRSDVYAAGIVLFELLTGKPPYQGESAMNVAFQHVHSRVPAPSSRVKGIPTEIDELVVSATDSDPTGRPADASAFLAEIADVREELGLPVTAIPPRQRPRARPDHRVPAPTRDSAATDVLGHTPLPTHDTQMVPHGDAPARRTEAPPPPVVIPPPKQRKELSRRARRRRRGLVALVIVLLLGAAAAWTGWWFAAGRYSRVPDVKGSSLSVAEKDVHDAGYKLGSVSSAFSETVDKDQVISTNPKVGSRIPRGRTVTFTVSLGKDRLVVPGVAKQSFSDAQNILQTRGLKNVNPSPKSRSSLSVAANSVIGTDPPAGTKVKRDQSITIILSSGPPIVPIPVIAKGTAFDDAKTALEPKFKVTEVDQYNDTYPAGTVVSVNPDDKAVQGSTVTVTVSKGPEFVNVPSIPPGTSAADASTALTNAGLVPNIDKSFDGGVLDQTASINPAAGTPVKVGSTVDVVIV